MNKLWKVLLISALLAIVCPCVVFAEEMPEWVSANHDNFEFFSDLAAPRVVDQADIFTDEQEAEMTAKAADIAAKTGCDVVIVTDVTDYGLDFIPYAEDFFAFNGYGLGDTYDGFCLYVDMDPDYRGYATIGSGRCREIHTEQVANALDDYLYGYFRDGAYGEGVLNWMDYIGSLCLNGYIRPEWYPEDPDSFTRVHNEDAPHIVDMSGFLTQEEKDLLEKRAQELEDVYGKDVLVMINDLRLERLPGESEDKNEAAEDYLKAYYYYNGYGTGEEYDGIALMTTHESVDICHTIGFGSLDKKFRHRADKRLSDKALLNLGEGDYYRNISKWLDGTESLLKNGRVPHGLFARICWLILIALTGAGTGTVFRAKAIKKMEIAKEKTTAADYMVKGSFQILSKHDELVRTSERRVYSPLNNDNDTRSNSSSSSSSGRSNYSSSHTGHSGGTYSGSGRRF